MEPEAMPLLVGTVAAGTTRIEVTGIGGDLVVRDVDIGEATALLSRMNGRHSWAALLTGSGLSKAENEQLADALTEVDALIDARQSWRLFHRMSSNPLRFGPRLRPEEAEALPRWSPPARGAVHDLEPLTGPLSALASRRRSFRRPFGPIDRERSGRAGAELLASLYGTDRPTASAGALYPLHLWLLEPSGRSIKVSVLTDGPALIETSRMDENEYLRMFVPDENVESALRHGASTIVLAADPARTVGKYGDRGWRFTLLEAGAAAHHLELLAVERGLEARSVGGFFDEAVAARLCETVPLHCVITFASRSAT